MVIGANPDMNIEYLERQRNTYELKAMARKQKEKDEAERRQKLNDCLDMLEIQRSYNKDC